MSVRPVPVLAAGYAVAVAGLTWYALVAGTRVYASTGDAYPGALTAVAEPLGYFTATLAGALCLGGLLFVVVTSRPDARGVIDEHAFRGHLVVERASAAWAFVATAMVVVQAAADAGAPVLQLVGSGMLTDAVLASEMARAWVAVTIVAVIVAVTARMSLRWITHVVLLLPAMVGVVALPVSGNAGQGPDHDYATSSAIVFAVALAALVGVKVAAAVQRPDEQLAKRLLLVEITTGALVLGYGASMLAVLLGPAGLTGSGYGRAGAIAAATLTAVWVGDVASFVSRRRGGTAPGTALRIVGATAVVVVLAPIAAMATQPAPRLLAHAFTTWDVFLGYTLPDPPSVTTILTTWRFDTFIGIGAVVLGAAYLFGYLRLRRRGDGWPAGRLVAWLAGCLMLLFTSSSGVKAYGSAMFSVHMAEHMTLNMFVPVLLVLGGPVTLALRTLPAAGDGQPPGPREWVLWLVHSKVTAFLANPIVAFVLFVASLYAVYFTPIFDTLVRYHWGHELMSVHFLLVGYLFFWGIIGIDPGPRRLPFLGRLGLLFAVMPFHAFFGIATMTMDTAMGEQFYRFVGLPWLSSIQDDQHLGGAIAWGSSELPVILVVVALVAQWARQDRRDSSRFDRHAESDYADDELDAYNAMLRDLARDRR
ncbi:cytochrome c oxidase assembly protein [Mycobacterium hodleri]|uniref:Cytochrome c oxidase assembly protein n=1 Tax=Mycolicibacterium hodleri TaxID=49897 RepID=A0A544VY40_9MYCO|nr:cytochrome c oxidase assembly protein [Mycolicibacterium hodleri]